MRLKSLLIKPSTEAFYREADKIAGYSLFDRIHGYVYGRWTYLYIGIGTGQHPIAKSLARLNGFFFRGKQSDPPRESRGTADEYHGKTLPLAAATQLVTVNEPVAIPDLEHVLPYRQARALILQNPDHIALLDCPCRSARENPCRPIDVCMVIGEPFASFVIEHHPDHSRWITQEQAVEILRAEDERGHVHHAFFKEAMLGRFYAICNCCACCCGAIHAHQSGTPMLASSGFVSQVDRDRCISCESCALYCQFGALAYEDGTATVDESRCMGCGVCISKCPADALSLRREVSKGTPLELQALMQKTAEESPACNSVEK